MTTKSATEVVVVLFPDSFVNFFPLPSGKFFFLSWLTFDYCNISGHDAHLEVDDEKCFYPSLGFSATVEQVLVEFFVNLSAVIAGQ